MEVLKDFVLGFFIRFKRRKRWLLRGVVIKSGSLIGLLGYTVHVPEHNSSEFNNMYIQLCIRMRWYIGESP